MEDNAINIQWFPGHMMKTLRVIERELKAVDVVVELIDARIPAASRNPELERMCAIRPHLLVLNKSDLAEPAMTDRWTAFYGRQGFGTLALACTQRGCSEKLQKKLALMMKDRRESRHGEIRAMMVGIPNVGKSTLINQLAGQRITRVEDRPGVTRGKQWIHIDGFSFLDMPGVLWPRLDSQGGALLLAFTGAIKDAVLDTQGISAALLRILRRHYPERLEQRYGLRDMPEDAYELLTSIARRRGMLLAHGEPDLDRASAMLLDELRGGKLGRITFETTEDNRDREPVFP